MASFDERLCLQWNDFKDNVSSAFGVLREDKEFTDVTVACEDGQFDPINTNHTKKVKWNQKE